MNWYVIELAVHDFHAMVAWYRDVLGLTVTLDVPADRFALLEAGAGRIALKERAHNRRIGGDRLVFEVTDLDGMVGKLQAQGVTLLKTIQASPEGYRRAVIADPEGREICLFERQRGARF